MPRRSSEQIATSLELRARQIRDAVERRKAIDRSVVAARANDAARAVRKLIRTVGSEDGRYDSLVSIANGLDEIVRAEYRARCEALDAKESA